MKVLGDCGLVSSYKDGKWQHYSINCKSSRSIRITLQNQINLSGKQIIKADYDTISNFINTMIGLLVLLVLVFMSGYLFIYNTLYISVNRDIRYFGQLKTIGTRR